MSAACRDTVVDRPLHPSVRPATAKFAVQGAWSALGLHGIGQRRFWLDMMVTSGRTKPELRQHSRPRPGLLLLGGGGGFESHLATALAGFSLQPPWRSARPRNGPTLCALWRPLLVVCWQSAGNSRRSGVRGRRLRAAPREPGVCWLRGGKFPGTSMRKAEFRGTSTGLAIT